MGAELVSVIEQGKCINKAFAKIVKRAEEYSGHQEGYSGDFNSTHFGKDVTSKLKVMTKAELDIYIEDNCPTGETWGYCIKEPILNKNKVQSSVETMPQKGSRVWETVYEAVDKWSDACHASDKSQTECIKKARSFVEKNPDVSLTIVIKKILTVGNQKCAEIKYKKSETEQPGIYRFIGFARS